MNGTEERDPAVRRFLAGIAARHEPPEAAVTPPPPHRARHRKPKTLTLRLGALTHRGGRRGA